MGCCDRRGIIDEREAELRELLVNVNAHAWMLRDAVGRIDRNAVDAAIVDAAKRNGEDVPAELEARVAREAARGRTR